MSKLLEELYAPEEVSAVYEQGQRYERRTHKYKTCVVIKEKKIFATRADHPRSQWKKFGIVSKGQLLNGTYDTEADAGMALAGLVPANPAARERVTIDAQVVKLF